MKKFVNKQSWNYLNDMVFSCLGVYGEDYKLDLEKQ